MKTWLALLIFSSFLGCGGGPAAPAPSPPPDNHCKRFSELHLSPCDGTAMGIAARVEGSACMGGRAEDGAMRLIAPRLGEPCEAERREVIEGNRNCILPTSNLLSSAAEPRILFVDLAFFATCDDPRCTRP